MNDIGYKEILHTTRIELQPASRLQDIEGHDVSHSHNPRAESVWETGLPQIQDTCGSGSIGILRAGDLRMDLDRRLLWKANEEVHLTPKEFDLLSYLFKNEGAVVTHVKLLRGVWGPEYGNELEYLRTYVRLLRKKIEDDPARPRYILTEPWAGYRFRNPSDPRAQSVPQSMSAMDWLSTSIVHDLRNPVATIYAGSEMLMNVGAMPAEVKRLAANMYRAAGRMQEMLAEVRCLTCGNRSITESCELRELIAGAAEAASAATENRSVRILLDVLREIELPLARSRIKRVFFNLITNALEAMPGGGELRIGARKADNHVLVEMEDTGPGIPHDIRDRVFEPFITSGKTNGLGLGLALSRRAVLDHGGDMWIEAAAGARFVICFPLTETYPGFEHRVTSAVDDRISSAPNSQT
jgi:DNA-binding winged helix-turn-helix (wHTH) protein